MAKDEHDQKGKQQNAEGMHGDKTHQAVIDSLRQRQARDDGAESAPADGSPYGANPSDGKHRLVENREQHDEADLQSEKNRIANLEK